MNNINPLYLTEGLFDFFKKGIQIDKQTFNIHFESILDQYLNECLKLVDRSNTLDDCISTLISPKTTLKYCLKMVSVLSIQDLNPSNKKKLIEFLHKCFVKQLALMIPNDLMSEHEDWDGYKEGFTGQYLKNYKKYVKMDLMDLIKWNRQHKGSIKIPDYMFKDL